jgi:enoyl-CoA hydratase/carnithine racemase
MNYDSYKSLKVTKDNGIATVTINRPETLNAISMDVHAEIERIWTDIEHDDEINVSILTGAGKCFSAGGNIKDMIDRWGTPASRTMLAALPERAKRLVAGFVNSTKPIVAAINGDAMGLGATIALLCDTSVISETARIGDTHVRVGLVAGDGGAVIWPLLIGVNRAKDFIMRGKVVRGKEATEIGITNYCAPAEQVMAEALKIAEDINSVPPLAARWTKISANLILKQQFALVMDACIAYECMSMASEDHLEACKAFVEKRKGTFKGA